MSATPGLRGQHVIGWDWVAVEDRLREQAARDLVRTGDIDPVIVGYDAHEPLAMCWLRPFPKGEYHRPIIEILAFLGGLSVDRIALAFGVRGMDMDADPNTFFGADGADLRERSLLVERAKRRNQGDWSCSTLTSFKVEGDVVTWGTRRVMGRAEGWIPEVLRIFVSERAAMETTLEDTRNQARRVLALGHELALSPQVDALLDLPEFDSL